MKTSKPIINAVPELEQLRQLVAGARAQLAELFHRLGFERVEFREPGFGLLPGG